jgi:hypothetical protein
MLASSSSLRLRAYTRAAEPYLLLSDAIQRYWSAQPAAIADRNRALACAHVIERGNRIAGAASQLVLGDELRAHERDSDRRLALVALQRGRARALGRAIDDLIDDRWLRDELALVAHLKGERDPDAVADAACNVLERLVELLARR